LAENSLLKVLYSELSDDQLIYKILNESDQLTTEATEVAKEEMAKRNIHFENLKAAREIEDLQQKNYELFKTAKTAAEITSLLNNIIEAKKNGTEDTHIVNDLTRQGIDHGIIVSLVKEAKQQCKEMLDTIRSDLFYGGIITVLGTMVAIFASRFSRGSIVFLPYGAVFYGLFRFLKGLSHLPIQKKLKSVIGSS